MIRNNCFVEEKEKNSMKKLQGMKISCIFAVSEMTNPVFSAWGKPTPTLLQT